MKYSRGFSLLEVLVAMAILAGGIIIVTSTWSGNFLRMRKSTLNNNVALLLERKMVDLESKYKNRPIEEIPEAEEGDFGTEFPQYRWRLETRKFEMPDLSAVLIGREGGADETLIDMIRQTQDYISQSVLEMKVSVIVKTKQRELDYSVSTYIVDYTKEFGLPGAGSTGDGN